MAAHPDDEVLGCGGTVARLSKEGDVWICVLGEGVTSRYKSSQIVPETELVNLKSQAKHAGSIIGAKDVIFSSLPDNKFDTVPMLEIVKILENLLDDARPDVVYTHHPGDLNVDHSLTFRAVMTATRPMMDETVREVYTFEIASSTDWAFQSLSRPFNPNTFVDISKTIDLKIEAMESYSGEIRSFPHPRSSDALRASAKRWGAIVGVESAEAFELIRSVR